MSLFDLFRRGSAPIARERLQVLLSHERVSRDRPDLLSILREEIVAVIGRHVSFEPDKVQIKMDRGKSVSTLVVDIEIPNRDGVLGAVSRNAAVRYGDGKFMRTIAFLTQKGGAGKNYPRGVAFGRRGARGERVIALDLDPQVRHRCAGASTEKPRMP